jgi:hypothetical protein
LSCRIIQNRIVKKAFVKLAPVFLLVIKKQPLNSYTMKSNLIITSIITLFAACNNANNGNSTKHDQPKTHEDSLLKDVMNGHDLAMGKMDKLSAAEKQVHNALDSISKLSEKSKKAAADYKIQLNALSENLKYADSIMNKWMSEFNYDSATTGPNISVYLESENQKIIKVKEAMLSALQKTDSLLKNNLKQLE